MPGNGPQLLNDLVIKRLCDALKRGNTRKNACALARLNESVFGEWLRRGRQGHPDYVDFVLKVRDAEAYAEDEAVDCIKFGRGGWQGAAWWLQRRNRNRWDTADLKARAGQGPANGNNRIESVPLEELESAIQEAAELKRATLQKKKESG